MENKAIQGEYPPASTYKIVTAMAGLEEGVIDDKTTFYCPGHLKYGDRIFRCWRWNKGGHGRVNVIKALSESCDVFFYHVGQKLGVDRLARYATACGLGSLTGIDLDHESKGLIPTASWKKQRTGVSWQKGETLSVAIGQGYNLVTPLQMLVLTAAVGNGGVLPFPTILKAVETEDEKTIHKNDINTPRKLPAKARTLDMIRKGLWNVVNSTSGTAKNARIEGLEISGKTGTAQLISRKKNEDKKDEKVPVQFRAHAWFVAYAPSVDPRIAVVVIVEHGEGGSKAAAPIARELIRSYMQYKI
jgi:penicillin-binding protein 2